MADVRRAGCMAGVAACAVACAAVLSLCAPPARAAGPDVNALLTQVGDRVREYFQRAQMIVATETVQIQPLNADLLPRGALHRNLVYEIRVAWEGESGGDLTAATVMRTLLKADGRAAKSSDRPRCLDLPPSSPEPLTMLLPEHRSEYVFSFAGIAKVDGRQANMIDFKSAASSPAEVKWSDDCVSWSAERTRGRIWADPVTHDVLRLDHYLPGTLELPVPRDRERRGLSALVVERHDSSIRYKPVAFRDPDEMMMLPSSIEILAVSRGSAASTVRTFQTFSDYKRFLGDSRLVNDER